MGKVVDVKSEDEFKKALAAATGKVAIEFVASDCGFCEDEKPRVEKIAEQCLDLVVIRADVDSMPQVAWDKFLGEAGGTPTLYLGTSAQFSEEMTPEKAKQFELDDSAALRRKLKCGRNRK